MVSHFQPLRCISHSTDAKANPQHTYLWKYTKILQKIIMNKNQHHCRWHRVPLRCKIVIWISTHEYKFFILMYSAEVSSSTGSSVCCALGFQAWLFSLIVPTSLSSPEPVCHSGSKALPLSAAVLLYCSDSWRFQRLLPFSSATLSVLQTHHSYL